MSSSAPPPVKSSAPAPLQAALEEHYQQLLAETKKVHISAPSLPSSKSLPPLSPRSTASTASSDVSPSRTPPTSPLLSPRSKRERPLASLDDDDGDSDVLSSPTASISPTLSSSSSSSLPSRLSSSSSSLHRSRLPSPPSTARVPSLVSLCTAALSTQLDHLTSLRHLPEEVVQSLLYRTIMRSALTPSLCQLFAESDHDSVTEWIHHNIDVSAVLVPTTQSCRERF